MIRPARPTAAVAATLALAVSLGPGLAARAVQAAPWLHLRAEESSPGGTSVRVNLPLALVEAVVALLPEADVAESRIVLGDDEVSAAELRRLWRRLQREPAGFVTYGDDGVRTLYRRRGEVLLVETTDPRPGRGRTEVRLPAAVVEALLAPRGDRLDLAAAVRALAAEGDGAIVVASESGDRVEVWVDRVADPPERRARRRRGGR